MTDEPHTIQHLSDEVLQQVDAVCDRFESAHQAGRQPRIEDYLGSIAAPYREPLLRQLVQLDVDYQRAAGASITASDYERRFPELDRGWLAEVAARNDWLGRPETQPHTTRPRRVSPPSFDEYCKALEATGLMTRTQLAALLDAAPVESKPTTVAELGRWLVHSGKLTAFQARMVYQGKARWLVLGDYELLDPLGKGGMGKVFRARHRRMDRVVALKILPPNAMHDPTAVQRFRREVKAAARLVHPNVVGAYDAGEDKGVHYLVMEHVPGDDLAHVVRASGPMSVEDAIDATIQAAHGLAYAHSLNIVHRDVKPHNLLLTRSAGDFVVDAAGMPASGSDRPDRFVIKVLDLGLARIDVPLDARTPASLTNTAAMTHSGMIMGTVEYMAPEQAADARLADHRSDVYALGCTLFYLLTGRHPFTGENFLDVLLAHRLQLLASLVTLRAEVPVELDLAFQRMTAKNPADRFQSMDELIVDLQHVLAAMRCGAPTRPSVCATESDDLQAANAETATMVRQVRAPLASRFASRSWRVATAVAVLAACGLGAAIWVGTHNRSHVTPGREPRLGRPPDLVGPFSSEQAARIQLAWSEYLGMPVVDSDRTGMRFALIPPGEFIMGSELDALDRWLNDPDNAQWVEQTRSESPARSVKITRPFYLGVTEVTVGQFRVFARATHHRTDAERSAGWGLSDGQWRLRSEFNWENLGDQPTTDHHPAVSISWNDATEYCRWLSERTKSSCGLPTEAQWEWACRAGSNEIWPSGSDATRLGEHAWFAGNSENLMHTVAQKLPNGFGLFDMVGNEWEWCDDYYSADVNRTSLTDDPHGSASGEFRVQRGGSAFDAAARVRMTVRGGSDPASPTRGAFRVVRVIDQ